MRFLLLALLTASPATAAPPNLVLFLADDLGWADCSPHGGPLELTPNMARLAKEGLTFTHAFVASPSCAPSRAALLTGLDPFRNGAMLNHARPRPGVKRWPAYFQQLGYETVAIGKTAHYAQAKEYGFDHASHFNYHQDDCIDAAIDWLAKRKSEKPLCLIVGTNWPHVPWPANDPVATEQVTLPPTLVDTPATRRARSRYAAAVARADRDLGRVYDAVGKQLGRKTLFLFTADHGSQFPFGKWNLTDAGVRCPLIAVWPDRIQPGTTNDALVSWIDILPTCLDVAGGQPPTGLSGRTLVPLFTGGAGFRDRVFLTHSGDGDMNRYPLRGVRTRTHKYIRNLDTAAEHHTHVDRGKAGSDGREYWDSWVTKARTDPAAAAVIRRYNTRPAEELYDLAADPWELRNLATDPAQAATLADLRAALDGWMRDQNDRGLETERTLRKK